MRKLLYSYDETLIFRRVLPVVCCCVGRGRPGGAVGLLMLRCGESDEWKDVGGKAPKQVAAAVAEVANAAVLAVLVVAAKNNGVGRQNRVKKQWSEAAAAQ